MFTSVFNSKTLQDRIITGFLLMGVLLFLVAAFGWWGNSQLSSQLNQYSENAFPSVDNLWKINEAQTQVQSSDRLFLESSVSFERRRKEMKAMQEAWKRIDSGFEEYNKLSRDPAENKLYKTFKPLWDDWVANHKKLLEINQQYEQYNILNPRQVEINALLQNKKDSPEFNNSVKAIEVFNRMLTLSLNQETPAFAKATESLLALTEYNVKLGDEAKTNAGNTIKTTTFLAIAAMLLGPAITIVLGIILSNILVKQVQSSCIQIATSSNQIAASGKELEATVSEQQSSTNEVTATAREIAANSKQLVRTIGQVTQISGETAVAAGDSQNELVSMENVMRELAEATTSIAAKLGTMSSKANNINSVVATITKVAVQTNLLSLNAAIEAEKAGEYGAGFSVVAREIRRLADQTAVATLEIEQMVKDMQGAVSTGVMEMDKFNNAVVKSVSTVSKISHQISQVIDQVQALTPRFVEVSQGMEEQSQGAEQISDAMQQLSQASQQTTDAIRETNLALGNLDDAAERLRAKISRNKYKSE